MDGTGSRGGGCAGRKRPHEEMEGDGENAARSDYELEKKNPNADKTNEVCWMCLYQTDEEAKRLMEFIVRSVGYIDTFNIAAQVSAFIHTRYKDVRDANGDVVELRGADPVDVAKHIKKHILHPKVRISVIIKELLEFQDHLHRNLVVEDVTTGLSAVDKGPSPFFHCCVAYGLLTPLCAGNVELYLKVISQITSLYKAETNNMLFGTEEAA
jgi:hypothetical protein